MGMNNWLNIALLGLIEGVTEFLPVSSTGHLLLAQQWLPRQSDLFNVTIQSGAVLAVLAIFRVRLTELLTSLHSKATQRYLAQLGVAFAITAVGGLLLKKLDLRLPESPAPVAWATLIGGVLFVLVEALLRKRQPQKTPHDAHAVSWAVACTMGVAQLLAAVFPGSSRSGSTILLALMLGCGRGAATEFSFLLGVPTLLAAGGLEVLGHVLHGGPAEDWTMLLLATVVAAVTAFATVRWLLGYVRSHSFMLFGLYRIALGSWLLWQLPAH